MPNPHEKPIATGVRASGGSAADLYYSTDTRVLRRPSPLDGTPLILKEFLGPQAMKRARHELRILLRLSGVDGVPELADGMVEGNFPEAILALRDDNARPLVIGGQVRSIELAGLPLFAKRLASIVEAVHGKGVIHKDINPSNILTTGPSDDPLLVDFGIASTFVEELPAFGHHQDMIGTLRYMAPEQTGRTGRAVDQRADLYALGATLYELAVGHPPFAAEDPLTLVHDILAKRPTAPIQLEPAILPAFSDIILRLLEKEPDLRYQSAQGLAHDLGRVVAEQGCGYAATFALGARDFPQRLSAPSRLIGREGEIEAVRAAFEDAVSGGHRGLLVTGPPGVGKTALINQLKPIVTAAGGWFVSGKFDQYRQDMATDGVWQVFHSLGLMLLAASEWELARHKERLLAALGSNAGLLAAVQPEIGTLMGVPPDFAALESPNAPSRLIQSGVDFLRTIASPARPIVIVVDDLQWAAAAPIAFVDAFLLDDALNGVLLVGAYRESEVDSVHPLAVTQSRWARLGVLPPTLSLKNLPPTALGALLQDMLRLPEVRAGELAGTISTLTGGNPYDTVELVNALRRDGVLTLGEVGWSWDEGAIRRYVGAGDVVDLLGRRMDNLPPEARALLETMACIGGEVGLDLLAVGVGLGAAEVEERLEPALEDGLVILEPAPGEAVRFRHDRVQQAAHGQLAPAAKLALHLAVARRLVANSQFAAYAAEQYILALEELTDPVECRLVAGLFRVTASSLRLTNNRVSERYLAAALKLVTPLETAGDASLLLALQTEWHAALCGQGRFEEADAVYGDIRSRGTNPLELLDATCVQVSSLTNRQRSDESLKLGLGLLEQFGIVLPPDEELVAANAAGQAELDKWVGQDDEWVDIQRAEVRDPHVLAAAKLIKSSLSAAFFSRPDVMAWLAFESHKLWVKFGPCATLVGTLSNAGTIVNSRHEDFEHSYRVMGRVMRVSRARGYELETAHAQFMYCLLAGIWFEPLESILSQMHQAYENLAHAGDLQAAVYAYFGIVLPFLDCAPTLERFVAEVDAGSALAARVGDEFLVLAVQPYRQLAGALRGEDSEAHRAVGSPGVEQVPDHIANNPTGKANFHVARALEALVLGRSESFVRHALLAKPLLAYVHRSYAQVFGHLIWGVALARQIRDAAPDDRATPLAEMEICLSWLRGRAADAPDNFAPVLSLAQAELAWALDDFRGAQLAFEGALTQLSRLNRPFMRALVVERAARFYLAHDLTYHGRELLAKALFYYSAWGAVAKVRQLEAEFGTIVAPMASLGTVRPTEPITRRTSAISSDSIDLVAVLQASQALSSETNVGALRSRVVELMGAMTGATGVRLLLWESSAGQWLESGLDADIDPATSSEADVGGVQLPLSAFRYAARTGEPLLVADATCDDRFSGDPYFGGAERCSLMVIPVLSQGMLRAMLLLENRLSSGMFTPGRLDMVMMLAGQLAVSLDNALLYASLQGAKEDAEAANRAKSAFLSRASHELRTPLNAILGFGQILERQNVSPRVNESVDHILRAGRHLLVLVNKVLDIASLDSGDEEMVLSPVSVRQCMTEVLGLSAALAAEQGVRLEEALFEDAVLPRRDLYVLADATRLKQALQHLVTNAIQYNRPGGNVVLACSPASNGWLRLEVRDSGTGIAAGDVAKLFVPFERLRAEEAQIAGTGLGLTITRHLVAAMSGTLTVTSALGEGSSFAIELPESGAPTDRSVEAASGPGSAVPQTPVIVLLFVTETPAHVRQLQSVLQELPWLTLMVADSASRGLEMARQREPGVILLDLEFSEMAGKEMLGRLRRSALTRDIPVLVTGEAGTADQREQLLGAGARVYVAQPLERAEFSRAVRQVVEGE